MDVDKEAFRPKTILWYQYLVFVIIGLRLAIGIGVMVTAADSVRAQIGGFQQIFGFGIGAVLQLALAHYVGDQGNRTARWIQTGWFVLAMSITLISYIAGRSPGGLLALGGILAMTAEGLALWLLFHPDSSRWFRSDRNTKALRNIFD